MKSFDSAFATKVFSDKIMREKLSPETYARLHKVIANGGELDISIANDVAKAMKEWAMELGATHYTHWFQPLTGITAEKHDSFIRIQKDGTVLTEFSGKKLIKGEPDASSFPSGGLRATFEARGYTAWDPTSYAFIKDNTLCIPTVFCSYSGQVLDEKTPLLRSIEAVSTQSLRILRLAGDNESTRVTPQVGAEQEYFLIDKTACAKRKDICFTGRTLFGARPPKGQELDDHYFGTLRYDVKQFMNDLDSELWQLGIYANTEHNEVAPCQHELAPLYSSCNIATDQNQLTMEIMKKVADKHNFRCLLHEKPFEHINGSGKHDNWSLSTNTGVNLLKPGHTPYDNTIFLLFLTAVIKAVDEYQDLLRISVASPSNDHRLGAAEAPPAIVSMYLGDELAGVLDAIAKNKKYNGCEKTQMEVGVNSVPEFARDTSDRNRTSPFAFTGNKFEFRMVGSSQSVASPNMVLNTIVADSLCSFADTLERRGGEFEPAARKLIRETLKKHGRIIFNGNNYSSEWVSEAEERGLCNYRTAAEAIPHFADKKNVLLFEKHKIFTSEEIHSRTEIMLENYIKVTKIEALTMVTMSRREILPASLGYLEKLTRLLLDKKEAGIGIGGEHTLAEKISSLCDGLYNATEELDKALSATDGSKSANEETANYIRDVVCAKMTALRGYADSLEEVVARTDWPFPTYGELLFRV